MTTLAQQTDKRLTTVLGIGVTGLSVARFLAKRAQPFVVCDTRDNPPMLDQLIAEFPQVPRYLGAAAGTALASAEEIVASPGLDPNEPILVSAGELGIPVVGDIELFARYVKAPVVAITGSNGKSTVTELLGEMARAATRRVAVGGNLGTPALDLLDDECELYILELSSFQLELIESLTPAVATILNLSEDHLDRYNSMDSYLAAKQRIFEGALQTVVNRDDSATVPPTTSGTVWSFGLQAPSEKGFGLIEQEGEWLLAGEEGALLPVSELRLKGRHNWANSLAALALGSAVGLPLSAMLQALRSFGGLTHRCQTVRELNGVNYINDSKATNVGATLAALEGLGDVTSKNLIWIAGGEGKGADFAELPLAVNRFVKQALLLGSDADAIAKVVTDVVPVEKVSTLDEAVSRAQQLANRGDLVLLSPACASFDMFRNFEARGDAFVAAVEALQ